MMIDVSTVGMDMDTFMEVTANFLEVMCPIILVGVILAIATYAVDMLLKARREAIEIIQAHPDEIEHAGFLVRRMIYRIKRKRKVKS